MSIWPSVTRVHDLRGWDPPQMAASREQAHFITLGLSQEPRQDQEKEGGYLPSFPETPLWEGATVLKEWRGRQSPRWEEIKHSNLLVTWPLTQGS